MGPGLVQCGAEKGLGHLTAHPGAYGHGIKGTGTGFLQWCLARRARDSDPRERCEFSLVKGVNAAFH